MSANSSLQGIRTLGRSPHLRWYPAAISSCLALGFSFAVLPSASAAEPTAWKLLAQDQFGRTSTGWSSADTGGDYSVKGTGSVSDGRGTTVLSKGTAFEAALRGVSASDVTVGDTFTIARGQADTFNLMTSWVARAQADGSQYNAAMWVSQTGRATLGVTRVNGKTNTWLGGTVLPFSLSPGQDVRGELQVLGTSPVVVRSRVWLVGSDAPAWQLDLEDDSASRIQASGSVGIRDYASVASAKVTVSHDDLQVKVPDLSVPTPPPPPVPDPVTPIITPRADRGATLGTSSFPAPDNATYVDVRNGSDGGAGSKSSPFKSVAQAVAKLPAGGTIVLRAGTYHESIRSSKKMTIQNYPGETVWFDGSSQVSDWKKTGATWVHSGWTAEFDSSMGGAATKARYVNPASPMAANPDQVFVNGVALKQVASASKVVAGTFAMNYANDTITIGSDPSGKTVNASDLPMAFALSGGATIQGIGVRRYATPSDVGAAVRLSSPNGVLRQLVITDNAMQGVALSNVNKTVDHLTVTNNGQLGIGGTELDGSAITNSVVNGNNAENFNNEPVSGGMKFTRSRGIKVVNNEVNDNLSAGIWFDASSYQIVATDNDLANNRSTQLELEVSAEGVVANNTMLGGATGILIHDTSDVQIYNNKIGDYSSFGLKISQDKRRQSDPTVPEAHDPRRPIPDPTISWVTERVSVVNNVFGNSNKQGGFQIYALDGETNRSADEMQITIDGNLFVKRIKKLQTEPTMIAWGQSDNHTLVRYETPDEFLAKSATAVNAQAPDTFRLSAMSPFIAQYAWIAKPPCDSVVTVLGQAARQQLGVF